MRDPQLFIWRSGRVDAIAKRTDAVTAKVRPGSALAVNTAAVSPFAGALAIPVLHSALAVGRVYLVSGAFAFVAYSLGTVFPSMRGQ